MARPNNVSGGVKAPPAAKKNKPKPIKKPKINKVVPGTGKQNKSKNRNKGKAWKDTLRPTNPKRLNRRARRTVRAMYKPALVSLRQEEKRLNDLQAKREADNAAFRQWLEAQAQQREQMAQAQQAAAEAAHAQAQARLTEQYQSLRNEMIDAAAGRSTSGSDMSGYTGFNVEPAGSDALDRSRLSEIELQRLAAVGQNLRGALSQNTMAHLAGLASKERSEHMAGIRDIQDARIKTRAEMAAKRVELLQSYEDRELEKAKARVERRNANRDFKLRKVANKIEWARLKQEGRLAREQMGNDRTLQGMKNKGALDVQGSKNKAQGKGGDPVDRRTRKKTTREINQTIASGIALVTGNPRIKRAWRQGNTRRVRQFLTNQGVPAYLVPVVIDVMKDGKLSKNSRNVIRGAGGIPGRVTGRKVSRPARIPGLKW